jgi:hypothetical protein
MYKTLTATFESEETLKNVKDDIVNGDVAGFPQEKIFVDSDKKEIKVITSTAIEGEFRKIFEDHSAKKVTEREWRE